MDEDRLLRRIICSQVEKNGKLPRGNKLRTTQQSYAKVLQTAGLVPESRKDAAMGLWENKFLTGVQLDLPSRLI